MRSFCICQTCQVKDVFCLWLDLTQLSFFNLSLPVPPFPTYSFLSKVSHPYLRSTTEVSTRWKAVRRPWVTPSFFLYNAPFSPQARQSHSCPFSYVPVLLIFFLNRYSAIASFIAEKKEALTAYRNYNHSCWSPVFQDVLIMQNSRVCFKHLAKLRLEQGLFS